MRLKSLHLAGFKSFCHPVEVAFQQRGITVVVGPNGCGKSNIVDAIRWVLGEQSAKHLRGGSMEDVIFAGSAYEKPTSLAEVTLTFSNTDGDVPAKYAEYSEIAVTRRLYRNGESVYMLNKVPVRLMDIRELFMDTGVGGKSYSIIEQGKVGEIVSARPQDRRLLIEEAAGIVKFKTKRQNAEKRLEETQQNLSRVSDIVQELQRQEEALRDQVENARLYLRLREESQTLDQQLSTFRWQKASHKEQKAEASLEELRQTQQTLSARKTAQEAQMQADIQELAQHELQLNGLRHMLFQKEREFQEADNQKALEQQNLLNFEGWTQRNSQEHAELEARMLQRREQSQEAQHTLHTLETEYARLKAKVDEMESLRQDEESEFQALSEELQDLQKRLLTVHTQLTHQSNQKNFLEERLEALHERQSKLDEQTRANRELLRQSELKSEQSQSRVDSLEDRHHALQESAARLEAQQRDQAQELKALESKIQELQYNYHATTSRGQSLEKIQTQYEDFDSSVKAFLKLLQEKPAEKKRLGILGVLAEFINIPADFLAKAAPVMADYLELIVVEEARQMGAIEKFCQQHKIGRLGFLALDAQPIPLKGEEQGLPLLDFIDLASPVAALAKSCFAPIQFTTTEDFWENLQWHEGIFVTRDWVSPAGSVVTRQGIARIGQTRTASLGFLERKQEIEQLRQKAKQQGEQLAQTQERQGKLKHSQEQLVHHLESVKAQRHECELELTRFKKEWEHDLLEHKRAQHVQTQLQGDLGGVQRDLESSQQKLHTIEESLVQLADERNALENQIERQREAIQVQRRNLDEASEELVGHRLGLGEATEKLKNTQSTLQRLRHEIQDAETRIQNLDLSQQESAEKIAKSQHAIEELENKALQLRQEHQEMQSTLEAQTLVHEQLTARRGNAQSEWQQLHQQLDEVMNRIHAESLIVAEQRLQREQLEEQLLTSYERHPRDLLPGLDLENINESKMASTLKSLRGQMNALPAVNLNAPEEYAVIQERLDFLGKQAADLQQAVDDLKKTIREINTESRRRFKEMFEQVNLRFKEVFTRLFGGGEAEMVLTEADDILEAGIDVVAQPPGKKLQNLNLFSGGEKALTAISLIFAIFLIKPSPFCLLDEVDAPLDDANVGRFNSLIQYMTSDSQFVIITHNKKTMEIGDILYGVTMEEPGVSKTVSVHFQELATLAN